MLTRLAGNLRGLEGPAKFRVRKEEWEQSATIVHTAAAAAAANQFALAVIKLLVASLATVCSKALSLSLSLWSGLVKEDECDDGEM